MTKQRDLIANASHELKTPLTIIATNLSVIKSEPDSTVKDNENGLRPYRRNSCACATLSTACLN